MCKLMKMILLKRNYVKRKVRRASDCQYVAYGLIVRPLRTRSPHVADKLLLHSLLLESQFTAKTKHAIGTCKRVMASGDTEP
jgi:hypothetical protein